MDNFLDTCIILAAFDKKEKFHRNSKEFLNNSSNLIISVYQEKKEMPFLFFRKEKILTEAIKSSAIPTYQPNTSKLTIKDQIILKKITAKLRLQEMFQQDLFILKKELILLKQEITYFIDNKVSRKVMPLDMIKLEIVAKIKERIQNEADSNILASAIQEHKENKLIIITNDVNDWKRETLIEALKETEYKEVPEIKYLF